MRQDSLGSDPAIPAPDPWLFVAEVEHRVANEFALAVSSIQRAAALTPDAEAKAALSGAALRLRHYAEAHRRLQAPLTDGPVDLAEYLRGLCAALERASLGERGVELTLVEESVEIAAERCWRVGLIVSELITNALRHGLRGGPGAITVEIARRGGLVACTVSDNGGGAAAARPGHGAKLVDALAEALGGSVERRFGARGAAVRVSFPVDADSAWPPLARLG